MRYKIVSESGDLAFDLSEDAPLTVGRGADSSVLLVDPSISRHHARLECRQGTVLVSDLGSRNGTFVNGARVERAVVAAGDVVRFGKVAFRLLDTTAPPERASPGREGSKEAPVLLESIVHHRSVIDRTGMLSTVFRATDLAEVKARTIDLVGGDRTQRRLALLLEVSKGLSRTVDIDALLDRIAGMVFQIMDVDHVLIDFVDAAGRRVAKVARDRHGLVAGRSIPQSILHRVVSEKIAVLSGDAAEDERFGGMSILAQNVRSAMCAPLIGSEDVVQGALYVDHLTAVERFTEDDLDFLIAFSNIAAVAIENSRFAEHIRRELLVRSNLERFFAPGLAARIAASPDELRLGGDKKTVAILFSDIRGFTALSEDMPPADMARLLTEYFTVMVDVVLRHEGTLDKFIGDCIMAQWGAPISSPADADHALSAAMDMMRELDALNAAWLSAGRSALEIGIGLNFGDAFAGYIGSERRLEYTVIGDPVNVASRLCSAASGGEILLTEELRSALSEPPPLIRQGDVELRGRTRPVPVYMLSRSLT